jgi:hypothetical protein
MKGDRQKRFMKRIWMVMLVGEDLDERISNRKSCRDKPGQEYLKAATIYEEFMKVEEEKGVCEASRKWKEVASVYPRGNGCDIIDVYDILINIFYLRVAFEAEKKKHLSLSSLLMLEATKEPQRSPETYCDTEIDLPPVTTEGNYHVDDALKK